ncbi:NupC/NupG family nucleoside CNT transporter [Arenicella xantha]|uniref:Nucleoside permease n=1 Tax=Arenicella xantha TaxID=644221 RepID=A0A395JPU5_9GAMM|nr:NupC/NupG family nucleoside CNT transporter [Arenicella xantha]RBP53363.1 CNT family concentrative nucleoside transporter [Arenicella xantha]
MTTLISLLGIATLLLVAIVFSKYRSSINWRTIVVAFLLQFLIGAFALYFPFGKSVLESISGGVSGVLGYAQSGISFLFGNLGSSGSPNIGFVFAFQVLPIIIFFSSLVSVLYYIGIMGWIIRAIGGALQKLLGTSRAESMSATANIFVSQTEAPLVIKPFVGKMSNSELFAVMVGGMATVAGSVLAGYVALGVEMKYLLAASFMAAPGGFLMAKLLMPETTEVNDHEEVIKEEHDQYANVIDAAAGGAAAGLQLAVNIGAMLIAFVALIAMLNGLLGWVGGLAGMPELSMQLVLGVLFKPVAFLLGVPWEESSVAGSLIGQKLVLNEFIAFVGFAEQADALSAHSKAVITFALCGFANFSSIAILLGGLATIAPHRRSDVARMGLRAVSAAFMANLMSAAIAGFFLSLA